MWSCTYLRDPDGAIVLVYHRVHAQDGRDWRHLLREVIRIDPDWLERGAEADDESSRYKATLKYAADLFSNYRPHLAGRPGEATSIPVTGGRYEVRFAEEPASLRFRTLNTETGA